MIEIVGHEEYINYLDQNEVLAPLTLKLKIFSEVGSAGLRSSEYLEQLVFALEKYETKEDN